MGNIIHDSWRQLIVAGGNWVEPATRDSDLRTLMRELRPMQGGRPLIRLGPEGDGGYVAPDDLDGVTTCISPGVSNQVGFDLAMAERGMDVIMADASVAGPPVGNPRFHFHHRHLDVRNTPGTMTLDALVAAAPKEGGDMILQMDIEGAEYATLLAARPETLARFRIMLVEFHNLFRLLSRGSFPLLAATFHKLLETHAVVHIHPNNGMGKLRRGDLVVPRTMEITFVRRDRGQFKQPATGPYPLAIDRDNIAARPPLNLPACWYA